MIHAILLHVIVLLLAEPPALHCDQSPPQLRERFQSLTAGRSS